MRLARLLVLVLVVSACVFPDSGRGEPGLDSRPEPPSLLVDDAEGSHSLRPYAFCWEYRDGPGTAGICTEFVGGPDVEVPTFTLAAEGDLTLNFQFDWDVTVTVSPEDGNCDSYLIEFVEPRDFVFHELGPPGDYEIDLDAVAARGDAHWTIRIHNEADLPYPESANC